MLKSMSAAAAVAMLLTGCATQETGGSPQLVYVMNPARITYETGPCFGTCPVFGIDVGLDGTGRFDGQQHTAHIGARSLVVSADQYAAFAHALAPYQPSSDRRIVPGEPGCENAPTDMPSVKVRWTMPTGATQTLYYYLGCAGDDPGMAEGLRRAVDALPVGDLVGRR